LPTPFCGDAIHPDLELEGVLPQTPRGQRELAAPQEQRAHLHEALHVGRCPLLRLEQAQRAVVRELGAHLPTPRSSGAQLAPAGIPPRRRRERPRQRRGQLPDATPRLHSTETRVLPTWTALPLGGSRTLGIPGGGPRAPRICPLPRPRGSRLPGGPAATRGLRLPSCSRAVPGLGLLTVLSGSPPCLGGPVRFRRRPWILPGRFRAFPRRHRRYAFDELRRSRLIEAGRRAVSRRSAFASSAPRVGRSSQNVRHPDLDGRSHPRPRR